MSSTVVKQVFLAKTKNFPKSHLLPANNRLGYLSETDNSNKAPLSLLEASSSQPDYKSYAGRLRTFANWPNKEIAKEVLAKAGFYYKNESDVVQCAYCYIEGYHWVAGDDPLKDHRTWSPACPFVMNSVEPSSSRTRATDTCGLYGVETLPNSVPEDEIHLERLGIHKNKGPAHPEKFSFEARLATFGSWPKSMKQTPKELADAGFYYLGAGDQTICFHCGGGLKDWEQNDSPWEQHALWFPKCSYVYLRKGSEYIQEVKEKRNPRASASSSESETKESAKEEEVVASSSDEEKDKTGDEKTLCKICYKNEVGVVFLPCGHVVACVECSSALKNCAICRKPLEATVRAFLS